MSHVDRAVARARGTGRLFGRLRDALRTLGDLTRGRQQFADGGVDLAHRRRLLLGTRRLLIGGGLEFGRGALHLRDRIADLPRERVRDEPSDRRDCEKACNATPENDRHGQVGTGAGIIGALFQESCLLLVGFGNESAKLIHFILADIRGDCFHSGVETLRLAKIVVLLKKRQFGIDQWRNGR